MATESRKNLYDSISTKFDIGSFDEFNQKMDNSESRKKLYESVLDDFDLGDFNAFEEKISLKKKVDSQPFLFDAPTGGVVSSTGGVASQRGSQTSQAISGIGLPGVQPNPQELQKNIDTYYQAQGKQSAISMYDNYQSSIKNIDDEISKNYPEDATGPRIQSGLEDFNTYKAKRDELVLKRKQFDDDSKAALKYINPIIESDINLEIDNNGLNKFTRFTDAGFEVADEYKIDDYAKEYAKQNGVSDDGTFKRLVYDKLKSSVSFNIIKPKIQEEFKKLFEKEFGVTPAVAIQKDYLSNFVEGEQIKSNLLLQVQSLNKDIKTKLEDNSKLLESEYKPKLESLTTDYKNQSASIELKVKQLNESYKAGLIPKESYDLAFSNIQNELTSLNSQYQQSFDAVSKDFLNAQNEVYSKYDKRYKRQVSEFTNMAEDQINEASSRYGQTFNMSDDLKRKYESVWTKATNKFLSEEEALKSDLDRSFIPNNLGLQFVKNIFIGLGSGIKNISSMYDFDAGYVFGDYMENSITSSSPEIKSALDLLDLTKVQSSVGRMLGGMAPVLGATALTAAATKSAPISIRLLVTGLGNYITETAQIGGGVKDEVFKRTGNIADANKAAKKVVDANLYLLPLYAIDGLPFLDDITLGVKNKFARAGVKAGLETATELPQEYFQGIFEELSIADKPISDTFKSMTLEKFTNTALNVIPTSVLLGGGGTAFSGAKDEISKIQGKSFAAKIDLFDLTETAKKQFIYDTVLRRGDVFTKAYVSSLFSSGNINEKELESFNNMIEDSNKIMEETKKTGLNKSQSKVYAALKFDYIQAKNEFDSEQDEVSKKLYKARMDSAEKSLVNYVSGGKPDAVVLTLPNNEQYVYSFETLNSIIDEGGDLLNQIISGDVTVGLLTDKNNPKAKALSDKLTKIKKDAIQEQSTTSQVPPVIEGGQVVQEGGEGVGQGVEGAQASQAIIPEEKVTPLNVYFDKTLEGKNKWVIDIQDEDLRNQYEEDGEDILWRTKGEAVQAFNNWLQSKQEAPQVIEPQPTKTTGVSAANKSQLNDLKLRVTDTIKSGVVQTAERAINTLKSILPGFDIVIHENEDSYNDTVSGIGGQTNTRGNFYAIKNTDGTYSGRIDINLNKANARTVAHEVAHAVLLKSFGENVKLFKTFRNKISKVLNSSRNAELIRFSNLYEGDVQAEEYLAELTAILEQQQDNLSPTILQQVAAIINDLVSKLTNGTIKPFENIKDTKDIIDFFNTISGAIREGAEISEPKIKIKNVGEQVSTKGKSKFQAENIFTGKESAPKFKNLSDAAKWLNDWANKNKVFSEDISKVSDEEFINKLVNHTIKELNAWESVKGDDYIGFYEEDIPNILNPGLQEFAKKRYGRLLTDEEIALYHMVSGFASPGADPVFDSSKGLEVFDKYMVSNGNVLSGYTDKQATIWEKNELGDKVNTGKLKFDENGNPVYSQVAPKYAVQSLNKFKNVINYFGGLKKAINWALSVHPYEEISKVMGTPLSGPKALGVHENLSKENGGFGIFGFTGPKLGSYILNRIGEHSTVTKDMWYARTMARLTGEPLVDSKGKALNEPWGQTKDGLRKRLLADKAWDIVAKKLNITPSAVQQKMWDFEKRLYEKLGTIEKTGYASEGFVKGSKEIEKQLINKSQKTNKSIKFTKKDGTKIDVDLNELQLVGPENVDFETNNIYEFAIRSNGNKLGAIQVGKKGDDVQIAIAGIFSYSNSEYEKTFLNKVLDLLKNIFVKPFKNVIITDSPNLGKGIGKTAYAILAKTLKEKYGKKLISDVLRSDAAEGLWRSLERKGLAKVVGDKTGPREKYYYEYVVPEVKEGPVSKSQKIEGEEQAPQKGGPLARIKQAIEKSRAGKTEAGPVKKPLEFEEAEIVPSDKGKSNLFKSLNAPARSLSKLKQVSEGAGSFFNKLKRAAIDTKYDIAKALTKSKTPIGDIARAAMRNAKGYTGASSLVIKLVNSQIFDRLSFAPNVKIKLIDDKGKLVDTVWSERQLFDAFLDANRIINIDARIRDKFSELVSLSRELKNGIKNESLTKEEQDELVNQISQLKEYLLRRKALDVKGPEGQVQMIGYQDPNFIYTDKLINLLKEDYAPIQYTHTDGKTQADAEEMLSEMKAQLPDLYNTFDKMSSDYYDNFRYLLDESLKNGLITKEVYDELWSYNYIPTKFIQHFIEGELAIDNPSKAKKLSASLKNLTGGSEEDVITNYQYIMELYAHATYRRIFDNRAAVKLAQAIGKIDPNKFGKDTKFFIQKPNGKDKKGNPTYSDPEKGYDYIKFMVNGVENRIIAPKQFVDIWYDSEFQSSPWLDSTVNFLSKLTLVEFIKGVFTKYSPVFGITQILLDAPQALISTKAYPDFFLGSVLLAKDYATVAKDVLSIVKDGKPTKFFVEAVQAGVFSDFLSTENDLIRGEKFTNYDGTDNIKNKIKYLASRVNRGVDKTLESIAKVNEAVEYSTRLAVYYRMKQNLIARFKKDNNGAEPTGQDLENIQLLSAEQARNVVDFSVSGGVTKQANRLFAYLNSSIQVFVSAARSLKNNPWKAGLMMLEIGAAGAGLLAYSLGDLGGGDDEEKKKRYREYRKRSTYEKESYFLMWTGNPERPFLRIPKPPLFKGLINLFEQAYLNASRGEEFNQEKMWSAFKRDIPFGSPLGELTRNPTINALFKYDANYDYFRKENIVKDEEKILDYAETKGATELYKKIGKASKDLGFKEGISPKRLQEAVRSYTGDPTKNTWASLFDMGSKGSVALVTGDTKELDEMFTGNPISDAFKNLGFEGKLFTKKIDYDASFAEELKEDEKEEYTKNYVIRSDVYDMRNNAKDIRSALKSIHEYLKPKVESKEIDAEYANRVINQQIKLFGLKDAPEFYDDVAYAKDNDIKAKILNYYLSDMSNAEAGKVMNNMVAKGLLSEEAFLKTINLRASKNK